MDERQVTTCLLRFQYMVDNLSSQYILPHLIQNDVISEEDAQQIKAQVAENDKIRTLLTILMASTKPGVFTLFLRSLSEADWGFVAVDLWNTYQTATERLTLPPPAPGDWLGRLGSAGRQIVDDDVLVETVALISNYKTLAILMGMTPASLVQLEQQHLHLPDRILKMLMLWKRREGRSASLITLVQLCRLAGVDDNSLKQTISKIVCTNSSLGNALL